MKIQVSLHREGPRTMKVCVRNSNTSETPSISFCVDRYDKKKRVQVQAPCILFFCDAASLMSRLTLRYCDIKHHASNRTFQCCGLRSAPLRCMSNDTHQPSLVMRHATPHASHATNRSHTPHFRHQHPFVPPSPCPLPPPHSSTALKHRATTLTLCGTRFQSCILSPKPKLNRHLNCPLGSLLLVEPKRFSWPRQVNRAYTSVVFCAVCLCELAVLRAARC